jgi:hypothetical protein
VRPKVNVSSRQKLKNNYAKYKKKSEDMLAALQKIESISEQEEEDIISEQNEEESSLYCTN